MNDFKTSRLAALSLQREDTKTVDNEAIRPPSFYGARQRPDLQTTCPTVVPYSLELHSGAGSRAFAGPFHWFPGRIERRELDR
jgi:hypothetical protein